MMNLQGQFVSTSFAARLLHEVNPAEKHISIEGDHLICDISDAETSVEFYIVPTPIEGIPHEELVESWRKFFA